MKSKSAPQFRVKTKSKSQAASASASRLDAYVPLTPESYSKLRYGMFIHYGLYSLLGRSEWALNRERLGLRQYRALAKTFTAEKFHAPAIYDLAVRAGMRYVVFTTMHHDVEVPPVVIEKTLHFQEYSLFSVGAVLGTIPAVPRPAAARARPR